MIKNLLLLVTIILSSLSLNAQIDQVSVGPGYSSQAYYNISTGDVTQVSNDAWDIAFSSSGQIDAGVFINESSSYSASPLKLYLAENADWNNPITDVSVFVDSVALYNPELNWTEGAFNTVLDVNNPFDYGWGSYNPDNHVIEGNKVFVIQLRDESFIKVQIESLTSGEYYFKYANLDGSNEVITSVSKDNSGEEPLIYFSFETGETVEMPTDYDLIFQRYSTPLFDGSNYVDYTVTGVLLAPGTQAVAALGVDPASVEEADYSTLYSDLPTVIGHDWKQYDFSSGWVIHTDRVYFVETSDNEKYKIQFIDFEGSSSGITTLEKTQIVGVSTEANQAIDISIFPNPTSDYVQIDGLDEAVEVSIYNTSGTLNKQSFIEAGNNIVQLDNLSSGVYKLLLRGPHTSYVHNLVITK